VADDATVVDLDPRREPVGEAEPTFALQLVEVLDQVGRRRVVVGDAGLEGHLGQAADGFGGDPGQGRD